MCKLIDESLYDNFVFDFTYIKVLHIDNPLAGTETIIFDMQ